MGFHNGRVVGAITAAASVGSSAVIRLSGVPAVRRFLRSLLPT